MNYIREAIEYLKNYQNLKIAAENLRDRLHELNEALEGYKGVNNSGMPHGSSGAPDDTVCNLIFQRDRTEEYYVKTVEAINKIENTLNKLEPESNKVLNLCYVMDLPEYEIIKGLNVSRATYHRQRSRAIKELAIQLFGISVIE